jgi:hypothetical protein
MSRSRVGSPVRTAIRAEVSTTSSTPLVRAVMAGTLRDREDFYSLDTVMGHELCQEKEVTDAPSTLHAELLPGDPGTQRAAAVHPAGPAHAGL